MTDPTASQGIPKSRGADDKAAPAKKLRLLVVDDHEVVRQGLAALLNRRDAFQVVAEAGNRRESASAGFILLWIRQVCAMVSSVLTNLSSPKARIRTLVGNSTETMRPRRCSTRARCSPTSRIAKSTTCSSRRGPRYPGTSWRPAWSTNL